MSVLELIRERDAALSDTESCDSDVGPGSFVSRRSGLMWCGHEERFWGDDGYCSAPIPRRLTQAEADRRTLLAILAAKDSPF